MKISPLTKIMLMVTNALVQPWKVIYSYITAVTIATTLTTGCHSLPTTPHLPKSIAVSERAYLTRQASTSYDNSVEEDRVTIDTTTTNINTPTLTHIIDHQILAHPSLSGYYPISSGADAFAARSILTNMATDTIDAQYYIWHNDEAGLLMLKDLWEAAERGVIVRLLLDDFNGSSQMDQQLLFFASHPNIAVRITNPFSQRRFRALGYITNPLRINVRMHNKSMTFDNRASIIGGRNIGNEYLNNHKNNHFADLDVLLVGQVVGDITDSFEQYWHSPATYDIEALVKSKIHTNNLSHNTRRIIDNDIDQALSASQNARLLRSYRNSIQSSSFGTDLLNNNIPFGWAKIEFLVDDVKKLYKEANNDNLLITQLKERFGRPRQRLSIISSYFVPTKDGVQELAKLSQSGVKISILTNSFDATDVGSVHAGYGHWRKTLIASGIRLYELKSTAKNADENKNKLWRTKRTTTTSLHAKAFAVDDYQVFIGSYNVDPRSAYINTELGVLIEDKSLATQLHTALNNREHTDDTAILTQAYEVILDDDGHLRWKTLKDGKIIIYDKEPSISPSERLGVGLLSLLPIDWLL